MTEPAQEVEALPAAVRALLARTGHIRLAVEVSPAAYVAADSEIARYIHRLRFRVDVLRGIALERDAARAARARAEARADRLLAGGDALAATIERVKALALDVADDLEAELEARYALPQQQRHYDRDMTTVVELRATLEDTL